jgi:hypothetical protein
MAGPTHAVSGKNAKIMVGSCSVGEATEWTANVEQGTFTYQSANGGGYQKVIRTNKKVSGTLKGLYDSEYPIDAVVHTDSYVSLKLYFTVSGNKYINIPLALTGGITFTGNMNSAGAEEWTCNFESDGPYTYV